ncbi:hypothetical protein QZJ86_12025 [Methylomonas montana]|uniref:hypothetical protein n=1 Tax=Methylomonas montana TaxID=3058963 RepID=UPI002659E7CD|nr:hypothetical protein [Methylomonas montana]WKJ88749.1 hypothetical protein QZJ86_12025 [Methylomonas montana]
MGDVLNFSGNTRHDIDPDQVLIGAQGHLTSVIVIGYDNDGNLFLASSSANGPKINWLLDKVKHKLINGDYSE